MATIKNGPDPSTPHPLFPELEKKYNVALDAFAGNVGKYVPRLSGQTTDEYNSYLQRAAYYGVVERTASAIVGAMTRKPFELKGNSEFPANDYDNPEIMLQYLIRDMLLGGRVVLLEDVGEDGKAIIRCYDADDIINWSDDYRVIRETSLEQDKDNRFAQVEVTRYRELYLDEDGFYRVNLWSKDRHDKWTAEPQPEMIVGGKLLTEFPMQVATPYDNTWDVYNPPLFVQASMNIQHFKKAIDLGHFEHFMSLPTFTISGDLYTYEEEEEFEGIGATGFTESGRRIVKRKADVILGSTTQPLHLAQGASASYTEASGSSHGNLTTSLEKLEEKMYIAGTRLLSSKKGVESVEALHMRAGAESAILETITNSLENAINKALEVCSLINRSAPQTIELNKDFTASEMDPARIKVLLESYVAGAISIEQFTKQLIEGEVLGEEAVSPTQAPLNVTQTTPEE